MAMLEPVDIDYDKIGDEDYKWDDDLRKDLEVKFNKLREFNETFNENTDEDTIEMTEKTKDALKRDTVELVANQIYDRLTIYFNPPGTKGFGTHTKHQGGGVEKDPPSISRTRNATNLKPLEGLGVSFKVSKNFKLV